MEIKKVLILVGVLITVVVVFILFRGDSNSLKNIKNYPSLGTNIMAFGDSLVQGIGSSGGGGFVSILSRQLGLPIENLGRGGDTTATALTRLDEVTKRDPKIVLILLGGNDYIRRISKEETFSNLGMIISSIQDRGAIVILLGVRGGVLKDNYKNDFKELAKKYKTAYIPNVLDGLIGSPNLMSDTIHPNNEGYQIIADRIYPVIKSLLN